MRKLVLLLVLLSTTLGAFAQQRFTVANDTVYVNGSTNMQSLTEATMLSKAPGVAGTLNMRWDMSFTQAFPASWSYQFCDPNLCHGSNPTSATFSLTNTFPFGEMRMDVNPANVNGHGVAKVKVYEVSDPANFKTITYIVNGYGLGVNASPAAPSLKIYPNPAQDVANIVVPAGAGRIDVYNVLGSRVAGAIAPISGGTVSVNVETLPRGSYIVRYEAINGKAITQAFYKVN